MRSPRSPPGSDAAGAEPEEARDAVLFLGNDWAGAHHDIELVDQSGRIWASRNRVNLLCSQQRLWSVHARKRG